MTQSPYHAHEELDLQSSIRQPLTAALQPYISDMMENMLCALSAIWLLILLLQSEH